MCRRIFDATGLSLLIIPGPISNIDAKTIHAAKQNENNNNKMNYKKRAGNIGTLNGPLQFKFASHR